MVASVSLAFVGVVIYSYVIRSNAAFKIEGLDLW